MTETRRQEAKQVLANLVDFINRESREDPACRSMVYDILTLLRGPDSGTEELKGYTSARVRGFLGLAGPQGGLVVRTLPLNNDRMAARQKILDRDGECHFHDHWNSGVYAFREIYRYDLSTETQLDDQGPKKSRVTVVPQD